MHSSVLELQGNISSFPSHRMQLLAGTQYLRLSRTLPGVTIKVSNFQTIFNDPTHRLSRSTADARGRLMPLVIDGV